MCRGPNRSQHFGRILGSLTGAVNRTDAKRYDNFDSKRAQSCEPERCAAGLRHAVTPLTRLTAFIQAHRIRRRRGLRGCYNGRVPLFRAHGVHPGTPHEPPTRLAPLLQRPRTFVPGSPRSSRHTAYTADAACAAATATAYPCSSGASRVRGLRIFADSPRGACR